MKRILLATDSFKGTMTAAEICEIQRLAIRRLLPDTEVCELPMADGGEGFSEACRRLGGGERVEITVTGPLHTPVQGFYTRLPDGSAAIEMAAASGLPLTGGRLSPLDATTFGVGELILHAAERGARRILLGLGGSATNDGGIGMAAALGYRFEDAAGNPVEPLARNLPEIAAIRQERELPVLEVTAACDVDNPLCGPAGATAVFGPQKGVTQDLFPLLEGGMQQLAALMEKESGQPLAEMPGAGAAGGLGAAVLFFLHGSLRSGIDMLLDAAGFDRLLEETDLVITGEGCMDGQSIRGKVTAGVGRRCRNAGVPCIALCGSLGEGAEAMYSCGISAMFSTLRRFSDMELSARTCREDMQQLTESVIRLLLERS